MVVQVLGVLLATGFAATELLQTEGHTWSLYGSSYGFFTAAPAGPSPSSCPPGLVCDAQVLEVCGGHEQAGAAAGIRALAHHGAGTRAEMLAGAPALNAHGKLGCTWPQAPQTKQKIKDLYLWLSAI